MWAGTGPNGSSRVRPVKENEKMNTSDIDGRVADEGASTVPAFAVQEGRR